MAALEDVLGLYDQSNFDIGSTAALIRQLGQQAGLSEEELAEAVPVFGDAHRAAFNSGYTEGSNYSAIAQRAVSDALAARGQTHRVSIKPRKILLTKAHSRHSNAGRQHKSRMAGCLAILGRLLKLPRCFPAHNNRFCWRQMQQTVLAKATLSVPG